MKIGRGKKATVCRGSLSWLNLKTPKNYQFIKTARSAHAFCSDQYSLGRRYDNSNWQYNLKNLLGTKFASHEDVLCQEVDPPGDILCGCELWGHSREKSDHWV